MALSLKTLTFIGEAVQGIGQIGAGIAEARAQSKIAEIELDLAIREEERQRQIGRGVEGEARAAFGKGNVGGVSAEAVLGSIRTQTEINAANASFTHRFAAETAIQNRKSGIVSSAFGVGGTIIGGLKLHRSLFPGSPPPTAPTRTATAPPAPRSVTPSSAASRDV